MRRSSIWSTDWVYIVVIYIVVYTCTCTHSHMRIVVIYRVVIVVVYIVVITVVYMLLDSESHAAGPWCRMGFTVTEYGRSLLSHCDLRVESPWILVRSGRLGQYFRVDRSRKNLKRDWIDWLSSNTSHYFAQSHTSQHFLTLYHTGPPQSSTINTHYAVIAQRGLAKTTGYCWENHTFTVLRAPWPVLLCLYECLLYRVFTLMLLLLSLLSLLLYESLLLLRLRECVHVCVYVL
jgi:hypothetical protein